jgi:hypothetical protein
MDGAGIESRLVGEIFCTRPDRPWGPSAFCTMGTGSVSRGGEVNRPGRGTDHPLPPIAEVKETLSFLIIFKGEFWGLTVCGLSPYLLFVLDMCWDGCENFENDVWT